MLQPLGIREQMLQPLGLNNNISNNISNQDKPCHPNKHRYHHHKVHPQLWVSSSSHHLQACMAVLITKLRLRPSAVQFRQLVLLSRNIIIKSSRNLQYLQYLQLWRSISNIYINMSRNLQVHQRSQYNRNMLIKDCCNLNACHHRWSQCLGRGQHHHCIFQTLYNTRSWIKQIRFAPVTGGKYWRKRKKLQKCTQIFYNDLYKQVQRCVPRV